MLITRTSAFTGKKNQMELDVTEAQIARWQGGEYIQDAMPQLTVDEREFIMTGTTPEEWAAAFPEEEE